MGARDVALGLGVEDRRAWCVSGAGVAGSPVLWLLGLVVGVR
jgi:hypothetical protein